ncbi:hypothetical protein [Paraburkholderia unamae]|uniref:Uncharacterized protein n=1 Tax=Paraburkholderia unamae TaxID=219649 RepID=A0ACC6RJ28_9BURK
MRPISTDRPQGFKTAPKAKKAKLPKGAVLISIPLFGGTVVFVQSKADYDQTLAALTNQPYKPDPDAIRMAGEATSLVSDEGARVYILGVFDNNLYTLVHEAAHCTFFLCDHIGIETRPGDANETYCYLLDGIVQAAHAQMNPPEMVVEVQEAAEE